MSGKRVRVHDPQIVDPVAPASLSSLLLHILVLSSAQITNRVRDCCYYRCVALVGILLPHVMLMLMLVLLGSKQAAAAGE